MPEQKQIKTEIQDAKEEISPKYEVYYSSHIPEELDIDSRIRDLRDEIFSLDRATNSKRPFKDVLKTGRELAQEGKFTFSQEQVTYYYTKEEQKKRRRTLKKGDLFEPPVVLAPILPPDQREKREEGIMRADYDLHRCWELVKDIIVSSRQSPITTLARFAKAGELFSDDDKRVITEKDWIGESKLEDEDIERKLAGKMAEKLGINLEDLLEYHGKIFNKSSPTYINKHDQHTVPYSQGGLTQRPIGIVSHWYEHLLVASDAGDALITLLKEKEYGRYDDEEALDNLIELTFHAYQINSLAAELIRSAIPLGPNMSSRFIKKRRVELCDQSHDILENFQSLHRNSDGITITNQEKRDIVNLSQKIKKGRGSIEGEITPEEMQAVSKLRIVTELADKNYALDTLNKAMLDIARLEGGEGLDADDIDSINSLIRSLKSGTSALYLSQISDEQHSALVKLQDVLDKDILIDIVVPERIHGVRPKWECRLDLDKPSDVIKIDPYGGSRLRLRKLLDVLESPNFKNVLSTGGPPRRSSFTPEQLESSDLDRQVYGDLRYVSIVEGLLVNELINEYYESVGVDNQREILELINPRPEHEEPPSSLQNVDIAAELIYHSILDDKKIATIGDCDQDGFFASINWRWNLEHMGVKNIDQKFNTRLEGHNVQLIDLLNLALAGNELIIVNDTGSSAEDVNTFKMIKGGANNLEQLRFFRDKIDDINGFDKYTEHEQKQIKSKLTYYINELERLGKLDITNGANDIDLEEIKQIKFSTGEYYLDEWGQKIREYKTLGEFSSLIRYLEGFEDLEIIVCDHHTASIEAVKYFKDNEDVIMVNPEWIRIGYEDKFREEMQSALNPIDGDINVEKINEIQRKYTCYPESDIVGTVTAGKVMKRLMELFNDESLVFADTCEYYNLNREGRYGKYRDIVQRIVNVSETEDDSDLVDTKLPSSISLAISPHLEMNLYIGDLWLERNPRKQIYSKIQQSVNSFFSRLKYVEKTALDNTISKRDAFDLLVDEYQESWGIVVDRDELFSLYDSDMINFSSDMVISRAISKIDRQYRYCIQQALNSKKISYPELRFYMDYAGEIEKSFYSMDRKEKDNYIIELIRLLAQELDQNTIIEAADNDFGVNISNYVEEKTEINELNDFRDLKKIYFDLIEAGYNQNGGMPISPVRGEVVDRRAKVRYEANKVWNKVLADMEESGKFTPVQIRNLQTYFDYGAYGLEFFNFVEAVATLGDAGSVGPERGLENRWIVRKGMDDIEKYVDEYFEAEGIDKNRLERVMPEIIRLVRISLRGTNIRSINWHQSRFLTHAISAFVNAAYRRAKEGRDQRAKDFWKEMADVVVKRSEDENIRRHRHTLPHAQEETIEIRERMLSEALIDLMYNEEKLDHPIIIVELQGEDFVDPVKGLRGLIAGELAAHFGKPAMVVVKEGKPKDKEHNRYSVSFRLPGKGNIASDMVQLKLAMDGNSDSDIRILSHGGHPEASGGTWEIKDGVDKLHEILDPIFENYEELNPNSGIVDIEELISVKSKELMEEGWEDIEEFVKYIDVFSIADTLATQAFNLYNPYGVGMPELLIKFRDLKVVSIANGQKNDGDGYICITVRDKRGNLKVIRSFDNLDLYNNVNVGDIIDVDVQAIARLRSLSAGNMTYKWPDPNDPEETIEVNTITGEKSKPHLDVRNIENIRRGN